MSSALDWARDGADWPNRAASAFVEAGGLTWHVQRMGSGPCLLLIHGTGASTHSWRDLAPILAQRFSVVAPDLPGHGFTTMPPRNGMSLPGMAERLAALVQTLGISPVLAAGHSAGAAILIRMCLDGTIAPRALISLNGALLPFGGVPGRIFSPLARLAASSETLPRLFAWRAGDPAVIARLLQGTGSRLDPTGAALYAKLARNPQHVAAAFAMMAQWDLHDLARRIPQLRTPLFLVAGSNDRTVPPSVAYAVHAAHPSSKVIRLAGLGHLAHEEEPERLAAIIEEIAAETGAAPAAGQSALA
jgi:magnesium chelatase accessory protein